MGLAEVDAALDAAAVARVARYLQELAAEDSSQYLVVTHRPEMYVRTQQLLAVYTLANGATQVVSVAPQTDMLEGNLKPVPAAGLV